MHFYESSRINNNKKKKTKRKLSTIKQNKGKKNINEVVKCLTW